MQAMTEFKTAKWAWGERGDGSRQVTGLTFMLLFSHRVLMALLTFKMPWAIDFMAAHRFGNGAMALGTGHGFVGRVRKPELIVT